ncbi:hypothetical protein ACEUZ9_005481 [Paracoccus litorisediminis]|uniref:hypothetical protein n=1 Tax=Paracoccus litorisediminis TaxID=2006130 RepID=UPI003733145C
MADAPVGATKQLENSLSLPWADDTQTVECLEDGNASKRPASIDLVDLAIWALGRNGASATCIARHMLGLETDGSVPYDSGDFGRCELLMEKVSGIRERLPEMAKVNRQWAALAPRWDEIKASTHRSRLIQSIIRMDRDSEILDLLNTISDREDPSAAEGTPGDVKPRCANCNADLTLSRNAACCQHPTPDVPLEVGDKELGDWLKRMSAWMRSLGFKNPELCDLAADRIATLTSDRDEARFGHGQEKRLRLDMIAHVEKADAEHDIARMDGMLEGLAMARDLCKKVRDRDDITTEEACGALEGALAIQDEINARNMPIKVRT